MKGLVGVLFIILAFAVISHADKGLTISSNSVASNYVTTTSTSYNQLSNKFHWNSYNDPTYGTSGWASGFTSATTINGRNYFATQTGIYFTTWSDWTGTFTSSPVYLFSNDPPGAFFDSKIRAFPLTSSSWRGYFFREDWIIGFNANGETGGSNVRYGTKFSLNSPDGVVIADLIGMANSGGSSVKVTLIMTSTSAASTTTWYTICGDTVSSGTRDFLGDCSDNLSVLTAQSKCFLMFLDESANRIYTACSSMVISNGINSRALSTSSMTTYPTGAGDLTSGLLATTSVGKMLYLGSTLGLAFEIETVTFTVRRVTLLFAGGSLSPFSSVILHTPSSTGLSVLYWGTSDGQIARVNIRDFTVFSSDKYTGTTNENMKNLYSGTTSNANAIYVAGSMQWTAGTPTPTWHTYKVSLTDCSTYSCSDCLANTIDKEYCGWCPTSGTCTLQGSCSTGGWSQSGICPAGISLSPNNGSTSGGTLVTYRGSYFNAAEANKFFCKWGNNAETAPVAPPGGQAVTSSTVTCASPSGLSGTQTLKIRYLLSANTYRDYSGPLNFNFYNCATFSSACATCGSATYPECGWCARNGICSAASACSSGSSGLEWQSSSCPSAGPVTNTPAYASAAEVAANNVRVSFSLTNFPSGISGLRCKFTGPQSSTLTVPTTNTGSLATCPMPTNLNAGSTGSALYTVQLTTTAGLAVTPLSTSSFQIFQCDGLKACFECSNFGTACTWCVNSTDTSNSKCQSSTTCPSGTTANARCAAISNAAPDKLSLSVAAGSQFTFTGADLNSASAGLSNCYWNLGATALRIPIEASSRTDTTAVCIVPASITSGNWSVSLGNSVSRQTATFPLFVYDCAAFTTCGTCITSDHSECDWCQDVNGPGCSDQSHQGTCATWLHTRNQCPALDLALPSVLPMSGGNITLQGDHMLTQSSASQVECLFTNPALAEIRAPATFNSTGSSFECTAPSVTLAGTATVSLTSNTNYSHAPYTNAVSLQYVTCTQFTDCTSCLAGNDFCHWCGATCTDICEPISDSASSCPKVISLDPTDSVLAGGERITITGEGFLTGSKKRDQGIEQDEEQDDFANQTEQDSILSGLGFASKSSKSKRALPYACDWGSTTTVAEVDATGTHLYCDTPPQSGEGIVPLTVLYKGNVYLTTPGINFFQCGSGLDVCDFRTCTQKEQCGWCVADQTCGSFSQCKLAENTINPVWQSECPTTSLSLNRAPLTGNVPISVTLSIGLPSDAPLSEIKCAFGDVQVPAISINTVTSGNDTTSTITCEAPASTQARETTLSVLYRGNKLVTDSQFEYADCGIYKSDCTRCVSVSYCGWCSKGNKCTMEVECASGWAKNKCPINKIAVGVGVGLGSFFFLVALLGVLFLIRRARRKGGLIIALREPNYEEIAWGNDTTLVWKVPSDNYKLLEQHLNRRDFLLQVAIAFNCPATEQDALAKAMVYVASAHGLAADLIQTCIRYEVQTCLHENTLFRNNSVASKMYKFFSRIVGIKYLFNCIARVILELEVLGRKQMGDKQASKEAQTGPNEVSLLSMTMELDQTKALGDDIDTDTNLLQLQLICQKLLNVLIKSSVKNIPAPFRKIFIEIDNSVMGRFAGSNDAVYKGIGGLFFLRFVCPAITAPHVYGLLESPPNVTTQRQLVLISKVIQNIANMQPPGKKEEYMAALNDFIVQAIPKIIKFYDNLRQAVNLNTGTGEDEQLLAVPEEVRLNGLAAIGNFLHTEKGKLRKWAEPDDCPIDHMQKEDLNTILNECEETYPNPPKKLKGTVDEAMAGGNDKKKKKKKSKA